MVMAMMLNFSKTQLSVEAVKRTVHGLAIRIIAQLKIWRHQKEEIVLCGDFNEHVYDGRLGIRLAADDLRM